MYQRNSLQACKVLISTIILLGMVACTNSKLFTGFNRDIAKASEKPSASLASELQPGSLQTIEQQAHEPGITQGTPVDQSNVHESSFATPSNSPVTPTIAMTANGVVERAINDYLLNRRSLLKLWISRGETYFPMIEKIFAEEGIPDELKYVALGESDLRPNVSSSAGAAGIWQFMPATARSAGLIVNTWVDERLDPEKSTRAAALHFKELYEAYNGNWHLVLAGYNCSFRCISRAVKRAGGSIDNPPSFWETYPFLPRETRGFIPKFIAAALIVSDPALYGITTNSPKQPYHYDIVEINGMLTLKDAARLANTDIDSIRTLNPSLLRSSLPESDTSYPLKLPFNSYYHFSEAFKELPDSSKTPAGKYIVRSGDSFIKIANQLNTTVSSLQTSNNINGSLIHPGQTLQIPGRGATIAIASSTRSFVQYKDALVRPIKLEQGFELEPQPEFTAKTPLMMVKLNNQADGEVVVPTIYKVRNGDTLNLISQRFDVSIRDIQLWNNVQGSTIFLHQELTLHTPASIANIRSYQVKSGDNLGAIAKRFGVSINNLKRWNQLKNNLIFPGQNLQLN